MTDNNIVQYDFCVSREMRAKRFFQKPVIIWFTGLSGAGKSTSANALENFLFHQGFNTFLLDGDNVRSGLCKDLGFSDKDRTENIRRVGELSKLMLDAGEIVLAAFISPFRKDREMVRSLVGEGEFIEVYIKASISTCKSRDPKGFYKKAYNGEISNFTGIDSVYEEPISPEIIIDTEINTVEQVVDTLVSSLRSLGVLLK